MAKKIVTLYIDDSSIRLMVTRGKRIKKWADAPLEQGLIKNAVILDEMEIAHRVKQLFETLKVRTNKVIVGVSGLHCLTRPITLPRLPNEMLDEAVKREAKRVLPVPLEQLYISWQTIPSPPDKIQVFLVAIPCQAADALFKALHRLELKPYLMDLKPLALARVVKEAAAIIVDVQSTEFDIVIMAEGIPQPVRTVPFPGEKLSPQEKLPLIKKDLDRTITFYNSNNPDKPLVPTIPVFVSGELANEAELCQSLSGKLGRPVLPMPSPIDCPGGLDTSRYMVNMGLTLKEIASGKEASLLATNLNTLPVPYRPKPISLTNILALPTASTAVGLLVFLTLLIQSTSTDVAAMRGQLNTTDQLLQQRLTQRQELTGGIAELENKIAEAEASSDNFIRAFGSLEKQSNGIYGLELAVNRLPRTISLTSINYANRILTMSGRTPSEDEVLSYLQDLDKGGGFPQITITSMKRIEGEGIDFTLVLKIGE